MTKRKSAIAASAMVAAGGNSVFVLASRKESLPADEKQLENVLASSKMSQFACKACGISMHALKGTSPFCITCGSGDDHIHETKASVKTSVTPDTDLTSLHCSTCDHATILQSSVVKSITAKTKTPIHCSCCGSEMFIKAEQIDEAMSDNKMFAPEVPDIVSAEAEDDDVGMEAKSKLKSGKKVSAESTDEEDLDADVDLDDLDEVEAAGLENFKGKQAPPFKSKSDVLDEPILPPDEVTSDDLSLEPFTVEEDLDEDLVQDVGLEDESHLELVDDPVLEVPEPDGDPLVDALEMDDTDLALAFVRANGRVIAMKGHVAVASFSRKSAGSNFNLANSDALPVAAQAAVKAEGLRKGLTSIGFALIKVPVSSNAIVARKMQEVKASFSTKEANQRKEFASIFALAAAGLNRGNWKGHTNPLRASMETELARLGVQSPKRVVASIFENSGIAYAETLLEVSNRLSKMSASARKELAEMLDMTSVVAAKQDPEDDDEDEDGDEPVEASTKLETRFARPALLRPKITSTAVGVSGASDILAGKASLSFNSVF